jgi:tetratricopeptide (TPR) repeat protein
MKGGYDVFIPLYPPAEAGDLDHKVSTKNPKAQQYFNQGLTFYYGFDAESAMRSFHQASVEDPKLAMAHWGLALAAGGDLNLPIEDPCMVLARDEIQKAKDPGMTAGEAEKAYIEALAIRYKATKSDQGSVLNVAQRGVEYALQMEILNQKYAATDPDVTALYAYSLMNLRPWLWWRPTGQPTREVAMAVEALDAALARFPNHIGLNHIKIHAVEEAPVDKAALGKASAEFLFKHAPVITPHLNHMPAHTFLLLGDWQRVVEANERAVKADRPWVERCGNIKDPGCNQLLVGHYYSHDMLFLDVGYGNQGLWEKVKPLSVQLEENVRKFVSTQPGLEHYLTTNVMMMVHFGQWGDLDALPAPDGVKELNNAGDCAKLKSKLASAVWFFGLAMAHAHLQMPTENDVESFQVAKSCVQRDGLSWGNNLADSILNVVQWRMLERIARKSKVPRYSEAVMFASLAVESEDLLGYDEPPGWYLSSRETYGAVLYLAGRYDAAVEVFKEDQRRRPNNSRSLFGLWKTLEAQRSSEAGKAKEAFNKQWKSDKLPSMDDM